MRKLISAFMCPVPGCGESLDDLIGARKHVAAKHPAAFAEITGGHVVERTTLTGEGDEVTSTVGHEGSEQDCEDCNPPAPVKYRVVDPEPFTGFLTWDQVCDVNWEDDS